MLLEIFGSLNISKRLRKPRSLPHTQDSFVLSPDEVDWKFKCFIHSWLALSSSTPGSAVYGDAQASAHRLHVRVRLQII